MQRKKLEALAEAIVHVSGYREPGSTLYTARNPGGLKAYSPRHEKDAEGNRVFSSVIDGMQALFFDTALKLEGMSRASLQPSDTLQDFAVACGQQATAAQAYVKFLRRALHDDQLNHRLPISYFLEEDSDGR